MKINKKLMAMQDRKYAEFQSKLTPTIDKDRVIGIRVPDLRKLAKEYIKDEEHQKFLNSLPHQYYDENMLHALLLSEIKDYELCISEVEKFLPYVDNWAVCDIMSPTVFKKKKFDLLTYIKKWVQFDKVYTVRFGVGMLMKYFLDKDFKKEYLDLVTSVHLDDYYVNMMVAWYFATALAKQWDDTIIYLQENKLSKWIHNKTIQKARESYRITDEQKEYLNHLKRQ